MKEIRVNSIKTTGATNSFDSTKGIAKVKSSFRGVISDTYDLDSTNVSSITENGDADHTIGHVNNMNTALYQMIGGNSSSGASSSNLSICGLNFSTDKTSALHRIGGMANGSFGNFVFECTQLYGDLA